MIINTMVELCGPGRWAAFIVIAGLVGCQPVLQTLGTSPEPATSAVRTVTGQLATRLEAELGRAAVPVIGLDNGIEGWRFVCGQPKEPGGGSFDYSSSRLAEAAAEGLVDDSFCALFETAGGRADLREFFVGTTDAPVVDWIERYGLPGDLFSE